jgi:hypothetical protein
MTKQERKTVLEARAQTNKNRAPRLHAMTESSDVFIWMAINDIDAAIIDAQANWKTRKKRLPEEKKDSGANKSLFLRNVAVKTPPSNARTKGA